MDSVTFELTGLFRRDVPLGRPYAEGVLFHFLAALCEANRAYLATHPGTPSLYASGVQYERERREERWKDIGAVLRDRNGDCEDLACWRVAELRRAGERAEPALERRVRRGGGLLYHVLVRRADGRLEDPSRRLGM